MDKVFRLKIFLFALTVTILLCQQVENSIAKSISDSDKIELLKVAKDVLGVQEELAEKSISVIEYGVTSADSIIAINSKPDSIEIVKLKLQDIEHKYKDNTYFRDYDMCFDYNTKQLYYIFSYSENYGYHKFEKSPGRLKSKNYLKNKAGFGITGFPIKLPNLSFNQAIMESLRFPWQACEIEAFFIETTTIASKKPINAWVIIMRGVDPPLEFHGLHSILVPSNNTYVPPPEKRNTLIQVINDDTGLLVEDISPAPYE